MNVRIKNGLPAGAVPMTVETLTMLTPLDASGQKCGECERISLSGVGYLLLSSAGETLVYEGREGDTVTKTELVLENGRARIRRNGGAASEMLFDPEKTTESVYGVPPFSFPLSLTLHSLHSELTAAGGRLRLTYRMTLGGESSDVSFLLRAERKGTV